MPNKVGKMILIRHGESIWNTNDPTRKMRTRFTGWANIPLSERGKEQARAAGRCLLDFKLHNFDSVFTSLLDRSTMTYDIITEQVKQLQARSLRNFGFKNPPVVQTWRLNERHYGALIGLTKDDAERKFGREQVRGWRLSWDLRPPDMTQTPFYHSHSGGVGGEYDWQTVIWTNTLTRVRAEGLPDVLSTEPDEKIPLAESVRDCAQRVLPLWEQQIVPRILEGQTVLVVAHSNTIRGMVKHIDHATLSDENLKQVAVPSAIPLIYSFERDAAGTGVNPIGKLSALGVRGRFLVTPELLVLSLDASQHLEMSENLENSTAFKDALRAALDKLTQQTRFQQLSEGLPPELDIEPGAESADAAVDDQVRLLLESVDKRNVLRNMKNVMEPGWMSLPIEDSH